MVVKQPTIFQVGNSKNTWLFRLVFRGWTPTLSYRSFLIYPIIGIPLKPSFFWGVNGIFGPLGRWPERKKPNSLRIGTVLWGLNPFLRVCVASPNVMFEGIPGQKHYAYLEASWAINEPNLHPKLYLGNGCEITSAIHEQKWVLVGGLKHLDLYQMIRF